MFQILKSSVFVGGLNVFQQTRNLDMQNGLYFQKLLAKACFHRFQGLKRLRLPKGITSTSCVWPYIIRGTLLHAGVLGKSALRGQTQLSTRSHFAAKLVVFLAVPEAQNLPSSGRPDSPGWVRVAALCRVKGPRTDVSKHPEVKTCRRLFGAKV